MKFRGRGVGQMPNHSIDRLKRHIRQHSGDKPFACNQCGFSCRKSSGLKYHRLSYTGERPFSCNKCNFSHKTCGHLRRYMKKYTSDASTASECFISLMFNSLFYVTQYSDRINIHKKGASQIFYNFIIGEPLSPNLRKMLL